MAVGTSKGVRCTMFLFLTFVSVIFSSATGKFLTIKPIVPTYNVFTHPNDAFSTLKVKLLWQKVLLLLKGETLQLTVHIQIGTIVE